MAEIGEKYLRSRDEIEKEYQKRREALLAEDGGPTSFRVKKWG
jgi:hypothetical protein